LTRANIFSGKYIHTIYAFTSESIQYLFITSNIIMYRLNNQNIYIFYGSLKSVCKIDCLIYPID